MDEVQVLEGSTFMISSPTGDVVEGGVHGLFHRDTRFLSRYRLTVNGETPLALTSRAVDHYSAAFFLTNPPAGDLPENALSIERHRFVGRGLHEDLRIENHIDRDAALEVRLELGADFADLFEVKACCGFTKKGITTREHNDDRGQLAFAYERGPFRRRTAVWFSEQPLIEGDTAVFRVTIPPRASWRTCLEVILALEDEEPKPLYSCDSFYRGASEEDRGLAAWRASVPRLETDWDLLRHVYERACDDLAALRLRAKVAGNEYALPAAGLPWFMAIFGRDTLITAHQALVLGPDLAVGALRALAGLQGRVEDDFREEEPGRILHEVRLGELATLGDKPHSPYYGSVDATPLFLVLLSETYRWTGDADLVRELEANARAALLWIDRYGDRDGDGYIEYERRSAEGLANQGWKDSWNAITFSSGTLAKPPIALCEVQGYVYDAKLRCAELAEEVWRDTALAGHLRTEAAALKERFNRDFWIEERGGYFALALDAGKRRVDSLTSNIGHLLWSGIVEEEKAERVVRRLFSPALYSGWGVRTLSTDDHAYNPIVYHNGTVWPHDNSLIAAGLARYGFREEAVRVVQGLLEAAAFFDHRLPEVFAGYPRERARFPVRYPTSSSPQAWSSGAALLGLRILLGLEPDHRAGTLATAPALPPDVERVALEPLRTLGRTFRVVASKSGASADLVS